MEGNQPASAGDMGSNPGPRRLQTPWSNEARVLQLLKPGRSRVCALQREAHTATRAALALCIQSRPRSLQPESPSLSASRAALALCIQSRPRFLQREAHTATRAALALRKEKPTPQPESPSLSATTEKPTCSNEDPVQPKIK